MKKAFAASLACVLLVIAGRSVHALSITETTDGAALGNALGGSGLTINSVVVSSGAQEQFGTYSGFTSAPITIADGLVMSTGSGRRSASCL